MQVALVPLLLATATLAGCVRQGAFHCTDDTQCTLGSAQGRCESAAGFCAFPDITCETGFRYGEQAGSVSNDCVASDGFIAIGGTVTGLADTGLVLQNNGADDLFILADGPFEFPNRIPTGASFAVTVRTEPATQTCRLANATGTAGAIDITDVTVTCSSDPGILCGTAYCDPATQVCCVKSGVPSCAGSCVGAGTVPIRCDDHQDCVAAGQTSGVCCGNLSGTMVSSVFCTSNTLCTAATHAYFCDPSAAFPCPDGGTCEPTSDPFPGYFRCF